MEFRLCSTSRTSSRGSAQRWAVLPQNALLVRPDRPEELRPENSLTAVVLELIVLGAEAVVWLQPQGLADTPVQMRLPTRAVERYGVVVGASLALCLRAVDIVLLGDEPPQPSGQR